MATETRRTRNPRCFLVYALAPEGLPAAEANRAFNEFIADPALPLAIFHDHFIGHPGGVAVFYVENPDQRDALLSQPHLQAWTVEYHPLIFSHSPSAFGAPTPFT